MLKIMWIKKNAYNPIYQNTKKKLKKKNNWIVFLIYLFGAISYLLSLHEIKGAHMACYSRIRLECIYFLVKLTFISSLLISISIYMILFKNYTKIHLFIIFFIFFIFFIIDHNNKLIKHGLFNFLGFVASTLIILFLFSLFQIFIIFIKKGKYFMNFLILFSFSYSFFKFKEYKNNHFFCDKWANGFKIILLLIMHSKIIHVIFLYHNLTHAIYLKLALILILLEYIDQLV